MTAPLTPAERGALVGIARDSIRARLGLGTPPVVPETGGLGERRGAFVTLHRGGELRGCIGRFEPEGSLARTVADMAVAAAFEDPRFPPSRPTSSTTSTSTSRRSARAFPSRTRPGCASACTDWW